MCRCRYGRSWKFNELRKRGRGWDTDKLRRKHNNDRSEETEFERSRRDSLRCIASLPESLNLLSKIPLYDVQAPTASTVSVWNFGEKVFSPLVSFSRLV